jgi:hypothetical protein
MRLLEWERIDRRVLGAIRFLDAATGLSVRRPLKIESEGLSLIRNRSYDYVIHQAPGLEVHRDQFAAPPATPALASINLELTVSDASRHYLPQLFSLALPRDPDPANAANADSLFQPVPVNLYPSPMVPVGGNWSVMRLAVTQPPVAPATEGEAIAGALVRVVRLADDEIIARGMSDVRGQALIIIPGLPVTHFNGDAGDEGGDGGDGDEVDSGLATGPVVALDTPVRLEFIVAPEPAWPANTGQLEANAGDWLRTPTSPTSLNFNLRTGQSESLAVVIDMTTVPE